MTVFDQGCSPSPRSTGPADMVRSWGCTDGTLAASKWGQATLCSSFCLIISDRRHDMILRTARRDFEDVVWAANSKTTAHKCGAPAGPFWAAPSDVVLYYHRSLAAAEAFAMPLLSAHVFASPAWRSRPKMAPGAAFPAEELRHWRPWQWTAKSSTAEPQ